ncbi:hypothetical protein Pmani_001900 [Petrolisthes manimaculis]|uniref:RING-type domain-containing protein n=1 Tax=Petrolisthes manimaculis TaxID=1843537 RepID=A0AAE1QJ67_9EUCA|nr:hypothetical protein Pmani_001900 [Petrolisthes manimaculis]
MVAMAGHGRPIPATEETGGRSRRFVLPLALTSRLQSNTLRQVFTSLRPLVTHTRQRTLSTYARRLHQRQLNSQSREVHHESEGDLLIGGERGESFTHPGLHHHRPSTSPNNSRENDDTQNVVINIELSNTPDQFTSSLSSGDGNRDGTDNDLSSPLNSIHIGTSSTSHQESLPASSQLPSATASTTTTTSGLTNTTTDHGGNTSNTSSEEDPTASRTASESMSELLIQFPEVRSGLVVAWQYLVFLLIILAKLVFDHFPGLVVVVGLGVLFLWANRVVKSAVARHARRPARPLLALLINLPAAVFLLYYSYKGEKLFYSVLLLPPDHDGLSVGELFWLVLVSDYVLKLVTVLVKAVITLLPHSLLHYQNRGKYFLVVEMGSQLYRSLAPVQPWLSYLLEGYSGPKKVLGVLLSAAYMVCKGPDVVAKMKCFQGSIIKFMNSVTYGHTPSKAQVEASGNLCPICHDCYQQPTILRCKHIFCEACVVQWFDRERTCPLCRSQVADDPAWRDGTTTHFIQLF